MKTNTQKWNGKTQIIWALIALMAPMLTGGAANDVDKASTKLSCCSAIAILLRPHS